MNKIYLLIILSLGFSVFETMPKREKDKRKRIVNRDSADVDGYLGPWAKYKDEASVLKPSEVSLLRCRYTIVYNCISNVIFHS